MTTISGHTTRANGTILTAAIYNFDHLNHIANASALNATKLEGATPPVVDGQIAVFDGASGALLRTGGIFAVDRNRLITAGSGLSGGGDLSVDRTLATVFASQAEAETGTENAKTSTPLRVDQRLQILKATQAEAEAGANNLHWSTPLRVDQRITALRATQAEAEAGTDVDSLMTPLQTAQAISALSAALTLGSAVVNFNQSVPWDTGIDDVKGGLVFITTGSASPGILMASANGGTNYTNLASLLIDGFCIIAIKNGIAAQFLINVNAGTPTTTLARTALTAGAGNVFFKSNAAANHQGMRIM